MTHETSMLSIHPSGRRALIVLSATTVEYSVTDAAGHVLWSRSVPNGGPRAELLREAAYRESAALVGTP